MTVRGSRIRQIGWAMALGVVFALFVALTFRVNAVKSEVVHAERRIVALKQETMRLETEFETRANQQQLANWNAVDFGYVAPRADQYLENERQLAALGEPAGPNAPPPIRVARAPSRSEMAAMATPIAAEAAKLIPASFSDAQTDKPKQARPAPGDERLTLAERLGMSVDMPPADLAVRAGIGE